MNEFILNLLLAFIGGILGASLGALGGFVIFGLLGVIGYMNLIFGLNEAWISSFLSVELFIPSVCFVGGAIATAYARKREFILCGKDIGRSLISLRNFSVILAGGLAGVLGFLLFTLLLPLSRYLDIVAFTVVVIPLLFKYFWCLTKTNDCEGTSHVLPSPYRFFERLKSPGGKTGVTIISSIFTTVVTLALYSDELTRPYAGLFMFFLSALALYLLFFSVPIPATHHICGTTGIIVVEWNRVNGLSFSLEGIILPLLWGISIASVSQLWCDITKRYLFDEGDIHVDPPAGGIIAGSLMAMWGFPSMELYEQAHLFQIITTTVITALCITTSLKFFNKE